MTDSKNACQAPALDIVVIEDDDGVTTYYVRACYDGFTDLCGGYDTLAEAREALQGPLPATTLRF